VDFDAFTRKWTLMRLHASSTSNDWCVYTP
jgi:hypothetical protein